MFYKHSSAFILLIWDFIFGGIYMKIKLNNIIVPKIYSRAHCFQIFLVGMMILSILPTISGLSRSEQAVDRSGHRERLSE